MFQIETRPFEIILSGEFSENVAEMWEKVIDIHSLAIEKELVGSLGTAEEQGFHDFGGDWCAVFETVLHDRGMVIASCGV